jgi:hypothetical protein
VKLEHVFLDEGGRQIFSCSNCRVYVMFLQVVVDQPIGKVRYAGVAGGLYMACETGIVSGLHYDLSCRDFTPHLTHSLYYSSCSLFAGAGGKPSRSRVTVLQRNLIDNQSLVEVCPGSFMLRHKLKKF